MKRIAFVLALVGLCVLVLSAVDLLTDQVQDADAQYWSTRTDNPFAPPPQAYNGPVKWKKADIITGTGDGFTSFTPTTGYRFAKIGIEADAPDAEQTIVLRFWQSATDSTTIMSTGTTVTLVSAARNWIWFDVPCAKVSLYRVDATDDANIVGLEYVN